MNRIMRAFCILLLLALPLWSQGKELEKNTGIEWSGWSESYKIGYVSGFLSSSVICNNNISFLLLDGLLEQFKKKPEEKYTIDVIESRVKDIKEKIDGFSIYGITVGQLQQGIDSFYKDYRNQKICIIDAVYIARMQIQGKNPDLIDAQTRYLRMQPIESKTKDSLMEKYGQVLQKRPYNNTTLKEVGVSLEQLLSIGLYMDANFDEVFLFCYGRYE